MSHNKSNRVVHDKRQLDDVVELETQFILRMPEEPARVLREAIRTGVTNLKDRFTIQLENDMRNGEVCVDHWLMRAEVVDLPTIVESLKTTDNKTFYKVADVCQMLICKDESNCTPTYEEISAKIEKKGQNEVNKKFLWPHGLSPPMKNVRRRRFRKTLRNKYVEEPEVGKEVLRLFREDNDAVHVKWEIISEDELINKNNSSSDLSGELEFMKGRENEVKTVTDKSLSVKTASKENRDDCATQMDLEEHDIFGGAVSDSDEDSSNFYMDNDNTSYTSVDLDRSTINVSKPLKGTKNGDNSETFLKSEVSLSNPFSNSVNEVEVTVTQDHINNISNSNINHDVNHSVNHSDNHYSETPSQAHNIIKFKPSNDQKPSPESEQIINPYVKQVERKNDYKSSLGGHVTPDDLHARMEQVQHQLQYLQNQRIQKQREVENMENAALRQRFQEMLKSLEEQIQMKETELCLHNSNHHVFTQYT